MFLSNVERDSERAVSVCRHDSIKSEQSECFLERFLLSGRLIVSHMVSQGQGTTLPSPPLFQVEHVAVEFIVEPFHPSSRGLRTMKTSAQ